MAAAAHRITLRHNPKYIANGLKSYGHLLRKCEFSIIYSSV